MNEVDPAGIFLDQRESSRDFSFSEVDPAGRKQRRVHRAAALSLGASAMKEGLPCPAVSESFLRTTRAISDKKEAYVQTTLPGPACRWDRAIGS